MPSNLALDQHSESFIRRQLDGGHFSSAAEVVRAGLRLLEEQERRHQEELKVLRDELAAGRESGEPEDAEEVFSRLERQFGEQLDPR